MIFPLQCNVAENSPIPFPLSLPVPRDGFGAPEATGLVLAAVTGGQGKGQLQRWERESRADRKIEFLTPFPQIPMESWVMGETKKKKYILLFFFSGEKSRGMPAASLLSE